MASFQISEWEDVTPIPQDDGPAPLAAISYTTGFTKLMDYFRAMLKAEEYSVRALHLTQAILEHNAANYTVWQYRRDCLKATSSDLYQELDFIDGFATENPKNYQIWNHRRVIVETVGDASRELDFTQIVFKVDAKNYHAWAHRQWAINTFQLNWSDELQYTEDLIKVDVRNNSAWNQRWFVIHNRPESLPAVATSTYQSECEWVWKNLLNVRKNESAWNYLRGIADVCPSLRDNILNKCEFIIKESSKEIPHVSDETEEVPATPHNVYALALAADMWEEEGTTTNVDKARNALVTLMDVDKIRVKAWSTRLQALE